MVMRGRPATRRMIRIIDEGVKEAVVHRDAGREIDDFDDVMRVIAEAGNQYGRVALVILVGLTDLFKADVDVTHVLFFFDRIHQFTADGVAVEIGITPPDDAGVFVHQCAGA